MFATSLKKNVKLLDLSGDFRFTNFGAGIAVLTNVEILRLNLICSRLTDGPIFPALSGDLQQGPKVLDLTQHTNLKALSLDSEEYRPAIFPKTLETLEVLFNASWLNQPQTFRNGPVLKNIGIGFRALEHKEDPWFTQIWETIEVGMLELSEDYDEIGGGFPKVAGGNKPLTLFTGLSHQVYGWSDSFLKQSIKLLAPFADRATKVFFFKQNAYEDEYFVDSEEELIDLIKEQCPKASVSVHEDQNDMNDCMKAFWKHVSRNRT